MSTLPASTETILVSESPDETFAIGKMLALKHPKGACFYLEGDLGAGKTLLTKGIAAGYGVPPDRVVSPTFALVNRYSAGSRTVYHVDLYRVETERELAELGLEELGEERLGDQEEGATVMVVEWSEKMDALGGYRRQNGVRVRLEVVNADHRRIRVTETGAGVEL
ncbi:MAG TPA: tRNA (adenosine(37)-N6)-threonylcarbamoyltransferase complex ATPase subunit type 1 TsaE [Vicinamibacteria bacterium]